MKYLASAIVIQSDGWRRRTLAPAPPLPKSILLSLSFYNITLVFYLHGSLLFLSLTISMPIIKPAPLASPTYGLASEILVNYLSK